MWKHSRCRSASRVLCSLRPYTIQFCGAIACAVLARACGLAVPLSYGILIDRIIGRHHYGLLLPYCAGIVIIICAQALLTYISERTATAIAQQYIASLRETLLSHTLQLSVGFFTRTKSGELVARIMNEVEGIQRLFTSGVVDLIGCIVMAVIAVVCLFRLSPDLALCCVGLIGLSTISSAPAVMKIKGGFIEYDVRCASVSARLLESITGIRTIKAFGAEARERCAFGNGVREIAASAAKVSRLTAEFSARSIVGVGIVSAIILFIGSEEVASGRLSLGGLVTFIALQALLVAPVTQIMLALQVVIEAVAALERAEEILAEPIQEQSVPGILPATIRGDVKFQNVTFRYGQSQNNVLRNVSLHIPAGTIVAIIGPSGAGKSTVINLLAGFHLPTEGAVYIDGVSLSQMDLSRYRQQLGVVLQDAFLFAGTVRDNIVLANTNATSAQIADACRIAGVDSLVEAMPDGLDTMVGEYGITLSGGERQRIAIARALVGNPRIVLLDEATAHLDKESERMLQSRLVEAISGRTTFIVAHRLETIKCADVVVVCDSGEIIDVKTSSQWFLDNPLSGHLQDSARALAQ